MIEGEFQKQLKKYHETGEMPVELAVKLLSETGLECMYEDETHTALEMAIKALEQLDKIRGIVSKSEYPREDVIRYKMICDVLGVEHV